MSEFPFALPFIRWAEVSIVQLGSPTHLRRIYDHELIYVLGGTGRIVIGRKTYAARPDQLFLIPPRVWHSFHADTSENLPVIGIHFDWVPQHDTITFPLFRPADEPVEEHRFRTFRSIPHWDWPTQPWLDLRGRPRVRQALEDFLAAHHRFDSESPTVAGAFLAAAIGLIAREARRSQQIAHGDEIGADALRRIERARALLENSLDSVETIAEKVGWSGDHLRRMFRISGQSAPYQLQTQARLKRARQLLREENLSIAQIAQRCGFDDASHFARAFKKDCGLTPRQFLGLAKKI